MDIIEFISGVALGGIVSWAISHEYHNKSISKELIETSYDTLVNRPIDQVWNLISNPENFSKFYYRAAKSFDDNDIGRGTVIHTLGLYGESKEYIVIWEPEHILAWGHDPYSWVNFIELKRQENKTAVFLRRRARTITNKWWKVILFKLHLAKPTKLSSAHYLTNEMLQKIKLFCESS